MRLWRPGAHGFSAARWWFVRLIGLVYLFAFWSLALQTDGLIGRDGILPAHEYLTAVDSWATNHGLGIGRFLQWPTVAWLSTSDRFLHAVAVGGAVLGGLTMLGAAPALLLPLLWAGYLSLSVVGRDFLGFQWDALLLEAGMLAIPMAPMTWWDRPGRAVDPPRVARLLIWWLLFRLMFGSGVVKLASGDPTWRDLSALAVHYETQPLPTVVAWHVSRLPLVVHRGMAAAVLVVELLVPWLMLVRGRPRLAACGVFIALQAGIALTGNYAFFNLLTIALCVTLLDDRTLRPFRQSPAAYRDAGAWRRAAPRWLALALAVVTVPVSLVGLARQLGTSLPGEAMVLPVAAAVAPFRSINAYGLFAVMTTARLEVDIEGSDDGVVWRPFGFAFKPDDPGQPPRWIAPFQPRLDWQMWFAALSRYDQEDWLRRFCARLLEGSRPVRQLLDRDPFSGRPPHLLRAVLYRYRFSTAEQRQSSGLWWTRERLSAYSPQLSREER